jgi:hypothetical protein
MESRTLPDAPAAPASLVRSITEPLDDSELPPATMSTEPPRAVRPLAAPAATTTSPPAAAAAPPANATTWPPMPEADDPTTMLTVPAVPLVDVPVERDTKPELPLPAPPLCATRLPLPPALLADASVTGPDPVLP